MSLPILTLSACAAPSVPPAGARVLVQVAGPLDAVADITAAAARSSGKPVDYVAASGGGWHALTLTCDDPSDCDSAVQRLSADRSHFLAVQRDERKRIVTP